MKRVMQRLRRPAAFFADRSALGTALAAAFFTLIGLGGIALVGDHVWLTYQRDLLKIAADAAGLATTYRLPTFGSDMSDEEVKAALDPIARRYILANVPEAKRRRAQDTLELTLTPNRAAGTVLVEAEADLGGIVFGRWLYGDVAGKTEVTSGSERIAGITEVALALDVTVSMCDALNGSYLSGGCRNKDSRLKTVQRAAQTLVDILTADDNAQPAIGLVPWTYEVRLDPTTKTRWQDNGWATYPTTRNYPRPYDRASAGETHTLPTDMPESWLGCVDQRSLCTGRTVDPWVGCLPENVSDAALPPGLSLALPEAQPFTMGFYPARITGKWRSNKSISYKCRAGGVQDFCYDESDVPEADRPPRRTLYDWDDHKDTEYWLFQSPQGNRDEGGCLGGSTTQSTIMPLTTNVKTIKQRIKGLGSAGSETYSTLGLVWGRRLLAHQWRDVWGGDTHPVDPTSSPDVQKALVLLTDGEDNHVKGPGSTEVRKHRRLACAAAKADGISVFTIAAMNTSSSGFDALKQDLTRCASKPEYAFVNNATSEALENTFQQIATELARFRRIM